MRRPSSSPPRATRARPVNAPSAAAAPIAGAHASCQTTAPSAPARRRRRTPRAAPRWTSRRPPASRPRDRRASPRRPGSRSAPRGEAPGRRAHAGATRPAPSASASRGRAPRADQPSTRASQSPTAAATRIEVGLEAVVAGDQHQLALRPRLRAPNGSLSPWTTSVGSSTASSSGWRVFSGLPGGCSGNARQRTATAPLCRSRAAGDAGAGRSPADDQRQLAEVAVAQLAEHRRPGLVELLGPRRGALAGDAVGLFDEHDAAAAARRPPRSPRPGRARRPSRRHRGRAPAARARRRRASVCARAGPCGVSISRMAKPQLPLGTEAGLQPAGSSWRSTRSSRLSASFRYWCTKAIAMLPSPTAAATRFTGPNRTSPHAKMPGTLVSSRYGSRSSSQRPGGASRRSP